MTRNVSTALTLHGPEEFIEEVGNTIDADHKPNEVCDNHHQPIANSSNGSYMSVPPTGPILKTSRLARYY